MDSSPFFRVRVPGKTFLVGEYLALSQGPSIVMTTAPCFEFSWSSESPPQVRPMKGDLDSRKSFHSESPAGRWLGLHDSGAPFIQFKDPFLGRGGFGASTAEFIGAWIYRRWLDDPSSLPLGPVVSHLGDHLERVMPMWSSERLGPSRFRDILNDYLSTFRDANAKGSGADLVSQIAGGLAVWDARSDEMRRFRWPFSELGVTLYMTGKKQATHEHLAQVGPLDRAVEVDMRFWVEEAIQSLALEDADRLTASVRGFGKVLGETGRVADHSKKLLAELADCSGVRAAKGCGAMGSDVILVMHDRSAVRDLHEFQERNALVLAATDANLWTEGVVIESVGIESAPGGRQ